MSNNHICPNCGGFKHISCRCTPIGGGKHDRYDIEFDNPEPIRTKMNMAMKLLTDLFPGKNVTFFMAEFGADNLGRRMYYASNGQRADMMKALQEYITANQDHG